MSIERKIGLLQIENKMLALPDQNPDVVHYEPAATHHIAKGVYVRTVLIPAGVLIVGKIHNTEHVCIIDGDIFVSDEYEDKHYIGHNVFVSPRGIKRIVRAVSDTWFTTVHHVTVSTVEEIEAAISFVSYGEYEQCLSDEQLKLESAA